MEILSIIYKKGERNIYNSVDRELFEKVYKPKGWQIVGEIEKTEEQKIVEELKAETKVKNYKKMKKVQEQPFDDGLIKKGE